MHLKIDGEALARLWLTDRFPELAATIDLPPVARWLHPQAESA